jgi:hypothetical protein
LKPFCRKRRNYLLKKPFLAEKGGRMTYIWIILSAMLIIAFCVFIAEGVLTLFAFLKILGVIALGVVAVIAVDGVVAFIIRRMPEKWFAPEAKLFDVTDNERLFYRKLKINLWKDHVPELGCFTGFHKDRIEDTGDSKYLGRFLTESNYGVLGHVAGAVLGYTIIFLPFLDPYLVAFPISAVNMVLSLLPAMILRFNTPSLRRLYRRSLRKERVQAEEKRVRLEHEKD